MDAEALGDLFNQEKKVRLILIGKTGVGKSSASNTILGQEMCAVADGLSSGTEDCDVQVKERNGLTIQITDTPGVCDTHRQFEEVHREIIKSLASVAPGPHAVLMCLRCDHRFTDEEYQAYTQLKELFGHSLTKHMILVFNGHKLKKPLPDFKKLEEKIPKLGIVLSELGPKKDERLIAIDNEAEMEDRVRQGNQILKIVSKVVADNNGQYFSDDILELFEAKLREKETEEKKTRDQLVREIVMEKIPEAAEPLKEAIPESRFKKFCTIL